MYKYEGCEVFYNGKKIYETLGDIQTAFPYKDNLILHFAVAGKDLYKYSDEETCRNVLSIDFNGEVLWRLPLPGKGSFRFHPSYNNLGIGKSGGFRTSAGGYSIGFDPDTGEILECEFTK